MMCRAKYEPLSSELHKRLRKNRLQDTLHSRDAQRRGSCRNTLRLGRAVQNGLSPPTFQARKASALTPGSTDPICPVVTPICADARHTCRLAATDKCSNSHTTFLRVDDLGQRGEHLGGARGQAMHRGHAHMYRTSPYLVVQRPSRSACRWRAMSSRRSVASMAERQDLSYNKAQERADWRTGATR
jgi:hypothetical protein